jgi:hypothetical protein
MDKYVLGEFLAQPSAIIVFCQDSSSSQFQPPVSDLQLPPSAVDIITILPTLLTFTISMVGDRYPVQSSQAAFLSVLQDFSFLRVVRLIKIQRLLTRLSPHAKSFIRFCVVVTARKNE